jgi:hypothetical protein
MGGDFDHRWTQAREAVLALKALWTQEEAELHRHYYDFPRSMAIPNRRNNPTRRSCWVAMRPSGSSGWRGMPTGGCRTVSPRTRWKPAGNAWTPWRPSGAGTRRR